MIDMARPEAAAVGTTGLHLAERVRRARIAFFDCDGVLLDSNRIKSEAVASALQDFPAEGVAACVQAFERAFGRGRREHFEVFYTILAALPDITITDRDAFVAEHIARYAGHLARTYPQAPAAPGAGALLAFLDDAGIPAHVVTGGVAVEAEQALVNAGLRSGLGEIHGTPTPKASAMGDILGRNGLAPHEAIMFGDARADRDAALATGCPFIFVSGLALVDSTVLLAGDDAARPECMTVENLHPHSMIGLL